MNKGAKRIAMGTLIAGAAGYLAGILTAPKSGSETRSDIKNARDAGMSEAEKQLKRLHTELGDLLGEVTDRAQSFKDKATDDDLKQDVVNGAKRAKQKAREILSAIHEGDADDKDLDKAVNEASKAIRSIRNYLKK